MSSVLAKKYEHIDSYYPRVDSHLIGRGTEHSDLLGLLSATSVEGKRVCFIEGNPGTGKSFLARSLIVPTEKMDGLFASGKCDQFHLSSPYDVIAQCLSNIVDQILLLDPIEIAEYKSELRRSLGFAANILVRMIPKIEPLLGEFRDSEREESFDFESTFQFAILQCLRVFSQKNKPFVVFIDDLQWIDPPSLNLIRKVLEARELSNILILLAYRSEEYKRNSEFVSFKREYSSSLQIEVKDFTVEQLENYLSNCFEDVQPSKKTLTELVYKKTAGNPFYVAQFLKTLLQKKILSQVPNTHTWRWTIDSLNKIPISENAAKFIEHQILGLDEPQKEVLRLMSCYGSLCEKDVIERYVIQKSDLDETLSRLLNKGFLIEGVSSESFRFSHDRIQQASFEALASDNVEKIHWKISQALLTKDGSWVDKHIIQIVNHLNKGSEYATSAEHARLIYEMNLRAADGAIFSIAYTDALGYCMSAIEAVNSFGIELAAQEAFDLYFKTALCAQLGRDFEVMEKYLSKIEQNGDEFEVLKALEIRISALLVQTKYEQAYEIFRVTLSRFGHNFPKTGSKGRILQELVKTESFISMKGMKVFSEMKPTSDKKTLILCRLLSIVFPGVYFSNAELVPIIVCMWLRLTMSKGYTIETPIAMSSYAMILVAFVGKVDKGLKIAEIAKTLLDNDTSENYAKYRAYSVLSNNILHLKYHWSSFYSLTEKSFDRALQFGDHEFAGFNASARMYFAYEAGERLETILSMIDTYYEKIKPISAAQVLDQFYRVNSRMCKLRGIENKYRGEGGVDYEADLETISKSLEGKSPVTLYTVKMDHSMFAYFDANFAESFEVGTEVVYQDWAPVSAAESNIAFFTFLAGARLLADNIPSKFKQSHIRKVLKKCAQTIEKFAATETVTNYHRHFTIKAIFEALKGRYSKAEEYFQTALNAVEKNKYRTDAGILKELYGRFIIKYRYIGSDSNASATSETEVMEKARAVLIEALNAYEDWGATLLSTKLLNRYKDIIQSDDETFETELSIKEYDSLLNSLQDIARYKDVDEFSSSFIKLIKGYIAGIDVSFFAHKEKGKWVNAGSGENENSILPIGILHRAQNTRENYFVRNVDIEPGISMDPFVIENEIKSFYAIPLTHQDDLIGLLYVGSKAEIQNGVKHLHLLEFLSRQASATLANILLVADLTESKDQFRNMYDSSKTGMLRIKPGGEIVSINETFKSWLCSDTVESLNDMTRTVWTYRWAEKVQIPEMISEMEDGGLKDLERDLSIVSKGKTVYISASCVRVTSQGQEFFDFSFNDNTESVEREIETRQRILAEEKVKDSSRFIANISHEFRTPLAVILALAKQLLTSGKDLSIETVNMLEGTVRNGNRLLKLVNDLLEFTKSKKASAESPETLNISVIFDEICSQMTVFMEMYGQRDFKSYIEPGLLISGYPDDIARIGFNIIQNAYKFTEAEMGVIEVKLKSKSGSVVLSVSDNGLGIPDSEQDNIFDRFYQASNNTNEGNGVGIGLSLVKTMVDRHGGTISIRSEEGKGTTFEITFPIIEESKLPSDRVLASFSESVRETEMSSFENARRKQTELVDAPTEIAQERDGLASILIVDDEPEVRSAFKTLLSDEYEIREASSGEEGIKSVIDNEPDLILLDMMMPKVDGLQVIDELNAKGDCRSKIIVLSAQNEQEIVTRALEMGADDFILKTVDGLELRAKVKNLIKNKTLEENLRYLNDELQLKIKDIKKAEAQLVHAEKNESISHIAKGVLHELNNPLHISLQELSFLQTVMEDGLDDEGLNVARDALGNAWQMQNRMADILADLKDYSNQDKSTFATSEDVSKVVESAIKINKYELASLEVETRLEEGLVAELKKSEIMQVITNLITNASKALKLSGSKRSPMIKIESALVDGKVRVSVEDNGPGIKDELKEKIFESFYTEFETESSGLGLNICKIILANHNSQLELDSDGESYTRFYFDLDCLATNTKKDNEYA